MSGQPMITAAKQQAPQYMAAFGLTALNTVLYFLSDGLQQPRQDSKEPVTQKPILMQL